MRYVIPRLLFFLIVICSISTSRSADRVIRPDSAQEAILNNAPKPFTQEIKPGSEGSYESLASATVLSSSPPADERPLESLSDLLSELSAPGSPLPVTPQKQAGSLQVLRQPSPQPTSLVPPSPPLPGSPKTPSASPQLLRQPSPLPTSPATGTPLRASGLLSKSSNQSSLGSAIDLSRPASEGDLTRSMSTLSLREEDLPAPVSLCLVIEMCAYSKEYMRSPGTKPFSVQPDFAKLKNGVGKQVWSWFAQTQVLWSDYREAQEARRKTEARYARKLAASPQEDLTNSVMDVVLVNDPPKPSSSGLLSSILPQRSEQTLDQKRAAILKGALENFQKADAAFKLVQEKAIALHPGLTISEIEALAYAVRPVNLYAPYFIKPLDFKPTQRIRAFTMDPRDLWIALQMLEGSTDLRHPYPGRVERLEQENAALLAVNTAYQRDIMMRIGSWKSVASWKDWYNLKGELGPLNELKRTLMSMYPFVSSARHQRNLTTYKGMVLAALHRDPLGHILWENCLNYIRRFRETLTKPTTKSQDEQQLHAEQYRLLPKHFQSDGSSVLPGDSASVSDSLSVSFQKVYEGCDVLAPDDEVDASGLIKSFVRILERKYIVIPGSSPESYIPAKGSLPVKGTKPILQNAKMAEEYKVLMADLTQVKDAPATVTTTGVTPNPLVEKMAKMPSKFDRMAREFRSFVSMEFHRELWYKVLQQLHSNHKPILIGCAAEGLFKPVEPKPYEDPIKPLYDPMQVKVYNDLNAKFERLLKLNRTRVENLMISPGVFSYLPYAFDFVIFTKPAKPGGEPQDPSKGSHSVSYYENLYLDNLGIHDDELQVKHRTSSGLRGLLSYCRQLSLTNNALENPQEEIDLSNLVDLNVSKNPRLSNLNFLKKVWGRLETLHASGNTITEMPPLGRVVNPPLSTLDISANLLESLETVVQFINLKDLDVSSNHLGTLMVLKSVVFLERLRANNCGLIGSWDVVLPALPNLIALTIEGNVKLVFLPYSSQKIIHSDVVAANNRKFNEAFPKLEALREQKLLKVEKEPSYDLGFPPVVTKPIKLSELGNII